MLYIIYIVGIILSLFWWCFLSILTFEKKVYEKLDEKGKESIDEMLVVLEGFNIPNIKLTFFLITMLATFLWPLFLLYLIIQKFNSKSDK